MITLARHHDGRVEEISQLDDSVKLVRLVESMRNRLDDDEIEGRIYDLIEAGEAAIFAEDVEIMGDILWLHLPDFDAQEHREKCGEAIIYAGKAGAFGLADTEIAEDLAEAGLVNHNDAERITSWR